MAKRTYRSANGKAIDMDILLKMKQLLLPNMRVNARDPPGSGGKIVRTREEVMSITCSKKLYCT